MSLSLPPNAKGDFTVHQYAFRGNSPFPGDAPERGASPVDAAPGWTRLPPPAVVTHGDRFGDRGMASGCPSRLNCLPDLPAPCRNPARACQSLPEQRIRAV
jgi:hypothetical protein